MQVKSLFKDFDELQLTHGDKSLNAIYGCGCVDSPKLCLVFMNPTAKNVSSDKNWKGIHAPWIGTKNIWKMLQQLDLISADIAKRITAKKPSDWDEEFALEVYTEIKNKSLYITNLSKATQIDARHLSNKDFQKYLPLLHKELKEIKPRAIIAFGGQVSSILLNTGIRLSESRKKSHALLIDGHEFKVYPVFYPVGQGMRNMPVAKEDIVWILKNS